MSKYQIGQKYLLKVFLEPEEMEFLGEITSQHLNGNSANITFDVFKRYSYGRPDLMALYDGKFFARSYDNTVEGLSKSVGSMFRFKGKGYNRISVGDISLSIEEFRKQVDGLLTEDQIEENISCGRYYGYQNNHGAIKWCPQCKKIRQTSCSACGCGNCKDCDYRWYCRTSPVELLGVFSNINT